MHRKLTNNFFLAKVHQISEISVFQKTSEGGSEEGPVPTGVQDIQAAQEASGEQPQEKATKGTKCK